MLSDNLEELERVSGILKRRRELKQLSKSGLHRLSGVARSTIQGYEREAVNVGKLHKRTVVSLLHALGFQDRDYSEFADVWPFLSEMAEDWRREGVKI